MKTNTLISGFALAALMAAGLAAPSMASAHSDSYNDSGSYNDHGYYNDSHRAYQNYDSNREAKQERKQARHLAKYYRMHMKHMRNDHPKAFRKMMKKQRKAFMQNPYAGYSQRSAMKRKGVKQMHRHYRKHHNANYRDYLRAERRQVRNMRHRHSNGYSNDRVTLHMDFDV